MRRLSVVALTSAMLALITSATQAEFTPVAGWDQQLFPSYIIASATMRVAHDSSEEEDVLGDRQGVLGVKIDSPADEVPVTVTITSDAILEPSTFTGTLDSEGVTYAIFPRIKYKYGVLNGNKQSIPVAVTFRVEIGDEEAEEQTVTMTLRSINDCPFTIAHADESFTDVSYVFAAYVNEQHPFVDKVLREALDGGVVDSFTGYQSDDQAEVFRQVYALWDALTDRDVRYSNITTSAAESSNVSSQHVRLIDESINNAQANCVDGSVLFASLLRKIDIEPVLVFVPGHCYLGFFLDADRKNLVGLETTLIGSTIDENGTVLDGLKNVVDDAWRKTSSWATFCAALAMGTTDLDENKDKFGDEADADYQLIPISAARQLGILPIAGNPAAEFEAATSGDD